MINEVSINEVSRRKQNARNALINYGIAKEIELLVKLNAMIDDNLLLVKTDDVFCCVDYEIQQNDEIICYLELKSRRGIGGYGDLMIGKTKMENISKLDNETVLLWVDADADKYYYCYYQNKYLKFKSGVCNGSAVIFIPKSELIIGDLNTFVSFLNQIRK